jgi:hypothetical protein
MEGDPVEASLGLVEVRVIEHIEGFRAELQLDSFREGEARPKNELQKYKYALR